jgi:hypothetical protein
MSSQSLFRGVAMAIDWTHALVMIAWGVGLPLLVWHRFPRISRAYMWFAMSFVVLSVVSHEILGECFLTTLARAAWTSGGGFRERVPFTVLLTNAVAGIRPSTRAAVLAWEFAVFASSLGSLWCWHKTHPRRRGSELAARTPVKSA